jgi:hypothetical protein
MIYTNYQWQQCKLGNCIENAAYLRRLRARGKGGGQNLLLQKIETGLDIDAAKVRDRIITERVQDKTE